MDLAKANQKLLRNFFGTLKGLGRHLKFIFITGVSKFSQVSLFSGFNNLNDITIDPNYATLLGYTEKEIGFFFKEHIEKIMQKCHKTQEEIIELMRHWYNGYGFSRGKATVYNPFSTLLFLKNGEVNNYWFQTATPTFLINQIKQQAYPIDQISGVQVGDPIFNNHDLEKISLISLMWQTGYLTIKNYDPSSRLYYLDYPNEEVKVSFLEYLAEGITNMSMPQATGCARDCALALSQNNLEGFFAKLKAFFSDIPYDMHVSKEKYYQTVFYVVAKLIGLYLERSQTALLSASKPRGCDSVCGSILDNIDPQAESQPRELSRSSKVQFVAARGIYAQLEVKTNRGRIDMVVITDNLVYLFEFKIDSSAEEALNQINDRKYFEKYLDPKKKLILIGVNFDTKERNISAWKALPLS